MNHKHELQDAASGHQCFYDNHGGVKKNLVVRLPTPGGDTGKWGNLLNAFLEVAHNGDGSLKKSAIQNAGGVTSVNNVSPRNGNVTLTASNVGAYAKPTGGIPASDLASPVQADLNTASTALQLGGDLGGTNTAPTVARIQGTTVNASAPGDGQVLVFNSTSGSWVPGTVTSTTVNDATASSKGIMQLAGDLSGTASNPQVVKVNGVSVSGTPSSGQVLTASNGTAAAWTTPASAPVQSVADKTGSVTLATGDLTDVSTSSLASGQVLTYNSTAGKWENQAVPSAPVASVNGKTGSVSLNESDLADVTIISPSANQVLAYNVGTSKWQNATITENDVNGLAGDLAARAQIGGDLGGTASSPTVTSTHLSSALPINQGGTGSTTLNFVDLTTTQIADGTKTWAADQYFKSGRPWFDVIAFGADPTGATDSTLAFNAAITAATGIANPATTTRFPKGPVYIPAGTYKVTSDILIQSTQGFTLEGAGSETTFLKASGTAFTTAVVNVDGSFKGKFKGFSIIGDGTEQVPNAFNLTWTTGAARSTSANILEDFYVRSLKFVNGVSLAGIGARQVDGTKLYNVTIVGQQTVGSWSSSGNWQQGFVFGNGTNGNIYNQFLYGCDATQCYYGYYCNVSGFALYGGQVGANAVDFFITADSQVTVTNFQSQNSGAFINGAATSNFNPVSFRDCEFNSIYAGAGWITILGAGATQSYVFENVECLTSGGGSPSVIVNNSGGSTGAELTLIHFTQPNSLANGIVFQFGTPGHATVIDYMDTSTSPRTRTPFAVISAGATNTTGGIAIPAGPQGATHASRWMGATTGGAPSLGTFQTGDFVVDQTGTIWVCTTGGSPGNWTNVSGSGASSNPTDIQWFTSSGTWTKPSGAQAVEVILLGGGGGGGSGGAAATGTAIFGGGGGQGGVLVAVHLRASDLSPTVAVTIGAGGSGGTAVAVPGSGSTSGNAGSTGGSTVFGAYAWAHGAAGGGAGTASSGSGGNGVGGFYVTGVGGNSLITATAGTGTGTSTGGGGAGGGVSAAGTAFNGGGAAVPYIGSTTNSSSGGVVGGASPTTGTQPTAAGTPSCGGGGGAAATSSTAQSGATPFYGGGGGGGGACQGGTSSGAGGNGGPGFALIITHFS